MSLGVIVNNSTVRSTRGIATDISTVFAPVKAGDGPATPVRITSLKDFIAAYGVRDVDNRAYYDWWDTYFREGGSQGWAVLYDGTDITFPEALDLLPKSLGPGLVVAITEAHGSTTYGLLHGHAEDNNRFAIRDVGNGVNLAAMGTEGDAAVDNDEVGITVGPWHEIPAPSGVVGGTVRTVPASAATCALIARAVAQGNPNRAAAGRDFPLQYVTGFVLDIEKDDIESLLTNHGVNCYATVYGVLELYGFQTNVTPSVDTPFWQANCSIGRMWLTARAQAVAEPFYLRMIDGKGKLAGKLKRALDGECLALYQADGLYGATPQDAFLVDVGATVNTVDEIAQAHLDATVEAVWSEHAKAVIINLVSIPVGGKIAV